MACKPLSARKAWTQIRSGRQPPAYPHPPFPSESIKPCSFTKVIGIKPPTLPPIGLLTPSLRNSQIITKEALSTETRVQTPRRAGEDPAQERVDLRLPGAHGTVSLACPFEFPLSLLRCFLSKEG